MSDSFLEKVLPKLGLLCFEYHSDGYFSCVGESPHWAMELFPCVRNRFPKILPGDISPFLENFLIDAEEFWRQNTGSVMRSGYWTESIQTAQRTPQVQGSEVNLEALVLTLEGKFLLLLEVSEVKFFETFHWLQTAREDRLDSTLELKESASQMMRASLFDALTGLPNQQAFYIQISQGLERIKRDSTQCLLLLKLTLDRFQSICATLSQDRGDQCLAQLAQRLKRYCREYDVVARLGEDAFGLLLHHTDDISTDVFIQQLMTELRSPYQFRSETIYTTNSIGVLRIEEAEQEVESLMGNVSLALRQAKSYGRDQYCIYDDALRDRQVQHLTLEQGLLAALDNRELVAEYRPLFSRQVNQFIGFEALLEWPQSAYSSEGLWILAETSGLGVRLAIYAAEFCLSSLRRRSHHPLTIVMHCTPQSLSDSRYQQLLVTLREESHENDTVILKLRDVAKLPPIHELKLVLQRLTALNLKLCLSLSDLETIPQLKDWFELMQLIAVDPGRHNLDVGLKRMAHPELRHWTSGTPKLFAEHVNDQHHDPIIADLGVDLCCGDFFSEPLPLEEFNSLLRSQQ